MYEQPRYEPLEPSTFFEDGSSSRPLVAGTVPRDDPRGAARRGRGGGFLHGLVPGQACRDGPVPG